MRGALGTGAPKQDYNDRGALNGVRRCPEKFEGMLSDGGGQLFKASQLVDSAVVWAFARRRLVTGVSYELPAHWSHAPKMESSNQAMQHRCRSSHPGFSLLRRSEPQPCATRTP
jgi:hypothetical protein